MPDAPWRCSQCGTVNEPVANSCRTCGKWPSLFDLQDSVVEDVDYDLPQRSVAEPEAYVPDTFEPGGRPWSDTTAFAIPLVGESTNSPASFSLPQRY